MAETLRATLIEVVLRMADEASESGEGQPLPVQTQEIPGMEEDDLFPPIDELLEPVYEPDFDFGAERAAQ